jgi:hypothetical protein
VFSRLVFAVVALAAVGFAGWTGWLLGDRKREHLVAWGAAGALAVSYLGVRLGRQVHPDHLQILFTVGSFACTLAYDRRRQLGWLVAAAALAGLAGAAKYVGVLIALPTLIVVWRSRRDLVVLVGAGLGGFLLGAPGPLVDFGKWWEGVRFQIERNSTGHLGYEATGNGWSFHLGQSLPGTWGWPLTVLGLVGLVWCLVRGTRAQRLAAAFVVPTLLLLGTFKALFPHHILVLLPFLAAYAFVVPVRVGGALGGKGPVMASVVVALTLLPTVTHDVRLLRAETAVETRERTGPLLADVEGEVWAESYALPEGEAQNVRRFDSLGKHPEVLQCQCLAVLSSYMEQRYRNRPDLYAEVIDAYDLIRAKGEVVETFDTAYDLSYRWDLLPQWGLDRLPLWRAAGPVGPTVTVIDLRG